MGAIFGIVGEGSVAEVHAMGRQATHRGRFQRIWSPAPGVYMGQASHRPFEADERTPMATDWNVRGMVLRFPSGSRDWATRHSRDCAGRSPSP